MTLDELITRFDILESMVDRVCKFLGGVHWSSYLEEFKYLRQQVRKLDISFGIIDDARRENEYERHVLQRKIDEEIKPKVDRLETKITGDVPIVVDKFKDSTRKKELAKEVFSVDMKNNMAQIKVRDKNIKVVSSDCLEGLSLIMKEYDNVSLSECFRDCKDLITLNFPSTFNTSSVKNMKSMFEGCCSLISLDLPTFNTSSVTSMSWMFYVCNNLSSLDLSTFNTSCVRDMNRMFYGCHSLISLNLPTFNTRNVINMGYMFNGCSSLISLNLSTFNTSGVTSMSCMFAGCNSLSSLDLSTFNASSVRDMSSMLSVRYVLRDVYVNDTKIKSQLPNGVSVKTRCLCETTCIDSLSFLCKLMQHTTCFNSLTLCLLFCSIIYNVTHVLVGCSLNDVG